MNSTQANANNSRRYCEVANDAAAALFLTDKNAQGGDRAYSLATNTLFTLAGPPGARVLLVTTAGAGAMALPLNQLAFGTGPGVASSPLLTFTPAISFFAHFDTNNVPVFTSDGNLAARNWNAYDATGAVILTIGTIGPARSINVSDELAAPFEIWDTRSAFRTKELFDSNGVPMHLDVTTAGVRTSALYDSNGIIITVDDTRAAVRTLLVRDETAQAIRSTQTLAAQRLESYFDSAGVGMLVLDTKAANRTSTWFDSANVAMLAIDTKVANRTLEWSDDLGVLFARMDTKNGTRRFSFFAPDGFESLRINSTAASHTFSVRWDNVANNPMFQVSPTLGSGQALLMDEAGNALALFDCLAAQRRMLFQNEAGATILELDLTAATAKAVAHTPIVLGSFTLAGANALTAGQGRVNGATAFISDARVGAEGPGAGTGALAVYKTAGVGSPAWFMSDGVTAVTA